MWNNYNSMWNTCWRSAKSLKIPWFDIKNMWWSATSWINKKTVLYWLGDFEEFLQLIIKNNIKNDELLFLASSSIKVTFSYINEKSIWKNDVKVQYSWVWTSINNVKEKFFPIEEWKKIVIYSNKKYIRLTFENIGSLLEDPEVKKKISGILKKYN